MILKIENITLLCTCDTCESERVITIDETAFIPLSTAEEIAKELKDQAEGELEARGWEGNTCPKCVDPRHEFSEHENQD